MKNETIDLIYRHASVRQYKPDPISKNTIIDILAAAQRASTSSNMQMFSVVVTTDSQKRAQMQALCGGQKHISQAPVFITWCADLSRIDRFSQNLGYTQRADYVENFLLAAVDTAIAMQTAGLAAESLGLGFCYIGAIRNNPREVIQMLNLPKLTFPVCGMTLGWPDVALKTRPRLPLDAVLHWDQYDPSNETDALAQYDQAMIDTQIYKNRQVTPEDPLPQSEYGWTQHTARRAAKVIRPHLREVLAEQGFALK